VKYIGSPEEEEDGDDLCLSNGWQRFFGRNINMLEMFHSFQMPSRSIMITSIDLSTHLGPKFIRFLGYLRTLLQLHRLYRVETVDKIVTTNEEVKIRKKIVVAYFKVLSQHSPATNRRQPAWSNNKHFQYLLGQMYCYDLALFADIFTNYLPSGFMHSTSHH
jgi:hypothetical protein